MWLTMHTNDAILGKRNIFCVIQHQNKHHTINSVIVWFSYTDKEMMHMKWSVVRVAKKWIRKPSRTFILNFTFGLKKHPKRQLCYRRRNKTFGNKCLSNSIIKRWHKKFKDGQKSVHGLKSTSTQLFLVEDGWHLPTRTLVSLLNMLKMSVNWILMLFNSLCLPSLSLLGSTWANLWSQQSSQLWLLSTRHAPVSFPSNHNLKYFNAVHTFIFFSFWKKGGEDLIWQWHVNSASAFVAARLNPTGHSLKVSVYLRLEHGNIILCHNHQGIVDIADNIYTQWDALFQDVVKGDIPRGGEGVWELTPAGPHMLYRVFRKKSALLFLDSTCAFIQNFGYL